MKNKNNSPNHENKSARITNVWQCDRMKVVFFFSRIVARDSESVIDLDEGDFHVFQLYDICFDCEPSYIVTGLLPDGSLLNYLLEGEGKNIDLKALVYTGAQVVEGMVYLEEKQNTY